MRPFSNLDRASAGPLSYSELAQGVGIVANTARTGGMVGINLDNHGDVNLSISGHQCKAPQLVPRTLKAPPNLPCTFLLLNASHALSRRRLFTLSVRVGQGLAGIGDDVVSTSCLLASHNQSSRPQSCTVHCAHPVASKIPTQQTHNPFFLVLDSSAC